MILEEKLQINQTNLVKHKQRGLGKLSKIIQYQFWTQKRRNRFLLRESTTRRMRGEITVTGNKWQNVLILRKTEPYLRTGKASHLLTIWISCMTFSKSPHLSLHLFLFVKCHKALKYSGNGCQSSLNGRLLKLSTVCTAFSDIATIANTA